MSYSLSATRCEQCRLHEELCLCASLPRLSTQTQLVLVPHARDWVRPSNTGRLATLIVPATELVVVGNREAPLDPLGLARPGHQHIVLHPAGDPLELVRPSDDRPVRLIVPDGTWRQSTRIARRLMGLPGAIRARVSPRSSPALRRSPSPDRSSTAEAIAAALDVLGDVEAARALLEALVELVARTRASQGDWVGAARARGAEAKSESESESEAARRS